MDEQLSPPTRPPCLCLHRFERARLEAVTGSGKGAFSHSRFRDVGSGNSRRGAREAIDKVSPVALDDTERPPTAFVLRPRTPFEKKEAIVVETGD
jgi:hypothetical protein